MFPEDAPVLILDLCDPVWLQGHEGVLRQVLHLFDAATAPTRLLRDWLARTLPAYVVPDQVDPDDLGKPVPVPDPLTRRVLWFGYSANFPALEPVIPHLRRLGLSLLVMSEQQPPVGWEAEFWPFEWRSLPLAAARCDFALNPPLPPPDVRGAFKSDNKTIIARALGRLVAHKRSELDVLASLDRPTLALRSGRECEETRITSHARLSGLDYERIIAAVRRGRAGGEYADLRPETGLLKSEDHRLRLEEEKHVHHRNGSLRFPGPGGGGEVRC